jgi:hypothetical protein
MAAAIKAVPIKTLLAVKSSLGLGVIIASIRPIRPTIPTAGIAKFNI